MAEVDLTWSDDDDDFAPPSASSAAAAAKTETEREAGRTTERKSAAPLLRPPSAAARPGKPPALAAMDRAAVDQRLVEVRKELTRLRREEARLVARQEQLELSDEARAEQQLRAANRTKQWEAPFPWDERVDRVLREHFRLEQFRPLQRGVVNAALSGQDVLVLMATGSGKSLCFQLPGMADDPPGLTLVISPLKSLMQDQCFELQKVGIAADFITADTPKSDATRMLNEIDKPRSPHERQFLYVTPERIAKSKRLLSKLEVAYRAKRIKRFVVDEVHCVAIDGNDFRPDYLKLAVLRTQFRDVPIIGCTATATAKVLKECRSTLSLRGACEFIGNFDRPNLFLRVMRKDGAEKAHIAAIADLIRNQHAGETGIVYCLAKKECENFADQLQAEGISAQPYHAAMVDEDRAYVHKAWRDGSVHVVCATIAFGMGINASGCRFVIHSTMSKGLDSYWQEAGRAGRDGSLAACTVFAKGSDLTRISSMVADVPKKQARDEQLRRLYAAFRFVLQPPVECRRASLLRWFDQDPREAIEQCKKQGRCDICDPAIAEDVANEGCSVDVADGILCLLKIVERLNRRGTAGKLTLIKLAETWRSGGAAHKSVRDGLHGEPPLPAARYSKDDCERIAAIAVCECFLEERFVASSYSYTAYVQLGKKGIDVLSGAAELPPTLAWLSKAAEGKQTAASARGTSGGAKKRKTLQCAHPATAPAPVAAASERIKESAKSMNESAGMSLQSAAVDSKTMKLKSSLGSKIAKTNGRQKSSVAAWGSRTRQQSTVDIRKAFAQHHSLQEMAQTHQQQRMHGNDGSGEYVHGDGTDDDIENYDSDAELRTAVAKIDAVYVRTQNASATASGSKPLTMNVGASGASAVPANDFSKTAALRKKRRVAVPSDDEEEVVAHQDFDTAASEFQAELRRAGGLSESPEPPRISKDSNGDDAFDIGADSIFD